MLWVPLPKQLELLNSDATVTLWGACAGPGKTDALLGLPIVTRGVKALLLRREFRQLQHIQNRLTEIMGGRDAYRATEYTWEFPNGSTLQLGSVPLVDDIYKFQGQPFTHQLYDEAAGLAADQIYTLMTWLRSPNPDIEPRLMMASNPPVGGQGRWMVDMFKPWIDPAYPNPARSGETRYLYRRGRDMLEAPDGNPVEVDGRVITPMSHKFIRATLEDNPFLSRTDYAERLQHLPDDVREALMTGDFMRAGQDQPLQCIPSAWVKSAMDRWKPRSEGERAPLSAIGVDVSRGGPNGDRTVLTCRYGDWVAPQTILSGNDCDRGGKVAAQVLKMVEGTNARVYVDIIGPGTSVFDCLEPYLGSNVIGVNGASGSTRNDRTGLASFRNRRSEDWWRMRERLIPETSRIELPQSNLQLGGPFAVPLTAGRIGGGETVGDGVGHDLQPAR